MAFINLQEIKRRTLKASPSPPPKFALIFQFKDAVKSAHNKNNCRDQGRSEPLINGEGGMHLKNFQTDSNNSRPKFFTLLSIGLDVAIVQRLVIYAFGARKF